MPRPLDDQSPNSLWHCRQEAVRARFRSIDKTPVLFGFVWWKSCLSKFAGELFGYEF